MAGVHEPDVEADKDLDADMVLIRAGGISAKCMRLS